MIPSREAHDILWGHLACLLELGAVPRKGVYDNEAALVPRHGGERILTEPFQRFRGTLGMGVIVLQARRSRSQGSGRAGQPVSRDQLSSGPALLGPAGLQRPARRVAASGPTTGSTRRCGAGHRSHRRGPGGDDGAPAGAARPRAGRDPAGPGSLGAGRHLRLLGAPQGDRPPRRGPRGPRRGGRHLRR